MVATVVDRLLSEARRVDERRALVLTGERESCYDAAREVIAGMDVDPATAPIISEREWPDARRLSPRAADRLLGTTQDVVVLDWHDTCRPNALGQVVGAVDGGGLLVILVPPFEDWRGQTDTFHESLAVPPTSTTAVGHRFHNRVIDCLESHRGIAIWDVDEDQLIASGVTNPAPRLDRSIPPTPEDATFPTAAYDACLTADQVDAVSTLETLRTGPVAVVVEADRGRGKSSAAGIAAACLASEGMAVTVTAPDPAGTDQLFERAQTLCKQLDADTTVEDRVIRTSTGGRIAYRAPDHVFADDQVGVLIVDEAAGLPVRQLQAYLTVDRLAFVTTVHGYEGAGRGFSVRFREHLDQARHEVMDVSLTTPIRYAAGDPIEVWAFHTLLLDARPAVEEVVAGAMPETTSLAALGQDQLADDEVLLRQVFGLLVAAHYRTEPNDLARLLDAPNIAVRALTKDGYVAAVALLAAEGGLDAATRDWMYDGGRISGNMLPDVFASQLRDPDAAAPRGWRVLRIATHPAVRSRGLGSRLLGEVTAEALDKNLDWVGVGYGATPELVRFWAVNGFSPVHLATTRTDASGEYSVLMLHPLSEEGQAVHDRLSTWFLERIPGVLGDALADADPDVIRETLAATTGDPPLELSDRDWRVVAGAAYGPGRYDVDPAPFQRLAVAHFTDRRAELSEREERLVVSKVLQSRSWATVADDLDYHSTGECMRALGTAYTALCDAFGGPVAMEIRDRYDE